MAVLQRPRHQRQRTDGHQRARQRKPGKRAGAEQTAPQKNPQRAGEQQAERHEQPCQVMQVLTGRRMLRRTASITDEVTGAETAQTMKDDQQPAETRPAVVEAEQHGHTKQHEQRAQREVVDQR